MAISTSNEVSIPSDQNCVVDGSIFQGQSAWRLGACTSISWSVNVGASVSAIYYRWSADEDSGRDQDDTFTWSVDGINVGTAKNDIAGSKTVYIPFINTGLVEFSYSSSHTSYSEHGLFADLKVWTNWRKLNSTSNSVTSHGNFEVPDSHEVAYDLLSLACNSIGCSTEFTTGATTVPDPPEKVDVRVASANLLQVKITPPVDDGGAAVTHYNINTVCDVIGNGGSNYIVRIEDKDIDSSPLHFCEIEFYDFYGTKINALENTATLGSKHGAWGRDPTNAFNGLKDNDSGSCVHTGSTTGTKWWQVEIATVPYKIVVTDRPGYDYNNGNRNNYINNADITVQLGSEIIWSSKFKEPGPDSVLTFTFTIAERIGAIGCSTQKTIATINFPEVETRICTTHTSTCTLIGCSTT